YIMCCIHCVCTFFFSSRRRHTRFSRDWSSDVCSSDLVTTVLLVAFAVGVGGGSLLCEKMSAHRIELGLVPFGSIGLSVFAIDLYFAQPIVNPVSLHSVGEFLGRPGSFRVLVDLALLGALGGLYSVP